MTKFKATVFACVFGVIALLFVLSPAYGCATPFIIMALIFGIIAWSKQKRDQNIIAEAQSRQIAPVQEIELPPMTTKGSNGRLFVPPPLH